METFEYPALFGTLFSGTRLCGTSASTFHRCARRFGGASLSGYRERDRPRVCEWAVSTADAYRIGSSHDRRYRRKAEVFISPGGRRKGENVFSGRSDQGEPALRFPAGGLRATFECAAVIPRGSEPRTPLRVIVCIRPRSIRSAVRCSIKKRRCSFVRAVKSARDFELFGDDMTKKVAFVGGSGIFPRRPRLFGRRPSRCHGRRCSGGPRGSRRGSFFGAISRAYTILRDSIRVWKSAICKTSIETAPAQPGLPRSTKRYLATIQISSSWK